MIIIYIDLNLSSTSVVMTDSEKVFGSNLTSVTNEPPIKDNNGNISYIGKIFRFFR